MGNVEHPLFPAKEQGPVASTQQPPRKQAGRLRMRSIGAGIVAAFVLVLLIALGSRGFHWFDAVLIG
jgi:hypothetical protein